jgi:hypothetical protein
LQDNAHWLVTVCDRRCRGSHCSPAWPEQIFSAQSFYANIYEKIIKKITPKSWFAPVTGSGSENVSSNNWGQSVVPEFSRFIQLRFVGIKGFSPQNIWRMKQFYETYAGNEKLSPLVREISWTNNVLIMMAAKTNEEREFYLLLSARNNYSKRELERQIDSSLFERTMISSEKNQLN